MVFVGAIILGLLGAAAGSFLNVAIFRLGRESVGGRSRCMQCGKVLSWYELIPVVSFVMQRGRCRACASRLSWQYPIVEAGTALLFVLVWYRFVLWTPLAVSSDVVLGPVMRWAWPLIAFWCIAAAGLFALAVYDLKTYLLPDAFTFPLIGLSVLGAVYQGALWVVRPPLLPFSGIVFMGPEALLFGRTSGSAIFFLVGAVAAVGLIGGIWFFSQGRAMGFGDVKLAVFMGLALGWPDVLLALVVAFASGTLVSLPLLLLGRKGWKSLLPFGPFLAFGTLVTMIAGNYVANAYFRFLPALFL